MRGALPVVCALVGGILLGLFLGDRTAALGIVADAYVRLLQMTVLPFIVFSTVAAIGRLNYSQAWLLARHLGVVLVGLWSLALLLVFLFPLVLPHRISASFFSSTLVEPPAPLDLLELYVPSNPFYSLANSIVPAVVLFSIVMGVALIGVPQKERLLDVLDVVRAAVAAVARFVVRLVPIGLFAIAAHAAGTLDAEQFSSLQAYVIAYCALSLLFALWMLPGLVSTLTGIPYRTLLAAYRDPVLTAFVTSDLFVVLPALTEQTRELIQRHGMSKVSAAPDVIVPASFNFPHAGKVLTLTFILFAAWFADVVIGGTKYASLAVSGVLVLFGNINVAMPFMLDMFGIPADTVPAVHRHRLHQRPLRLSGGSCTHRLGRGARHVAGGQGHHHRAPPPVAVWGIDGDDHGGDGRGDSGDVRAPGPVRVQRRRRRHADGAAHTAAS